MKKFVTRIISFRISDNKRTYADQQASASGSGPGEQTIVPNTGSSTLPVSIDYLNPHFVLGYN